MWSTRNILLACAVAISLAYTVSVWHQVTTPATRFALVSWDIGPVRVDLQTGRAWILARQDLNLHRLVFHELQDKDVQDLLDQVETRRRELERAGR